MKVDPTTVGRRARLIATTATLALAATGACRAPGSTTAMTATTTAATTAATTIPTVPVAALNRDRYRRPDLLVAALPIAAGAAIADVGAGDGYLTHRLAVRAGASGRVTATDVDPNALARIGASQAGEAPIVTRTVTADDPGLERGSYDLILLSEVDHLLADRADYLRRLIPALKPGGHIAVSNRRGHRAALLDAAARAGLSVTDEYGGLPTHFLIQIKP